MTAQSLALCQQLERSLLTVWPSLSTIMLDGWALRVAGGYSGRANSASALEVGAVLSPALTAKITSHYRDAGLVATVRVTPVAAADTIPRLLSQGFTLSENSLTQVAVLDDAFGYAEQVGFSTVPHDTWTQGVCRSQAGQHRVPDKLHAIVSRIAVPRRFATFRVDGVAVAFGMAAIDGDWAEFGCITVDNDARGKGYGRAIVTSLMTWAKSAGATHAFLQVDVDNHAALGLYDGLGFSTLYDYQTFRRHDIASA